MRQRKDPKTGEVYLSMEQLFAYLYKQKSGIDLDLVFSGCANIEKFIEEYDRDLIRADIRHLLDACNAMQIDCSLYKCGRNYRITETICDMFCYIVLYFIPMYGNKIIDKKWDQIKREHLVELRRLLAEALFNTGLCEDAVKAELKKFERTTKCPVTYFNTFSQVTDRAVNYWKAEYADKLTTQQWDSLYAEAEFEFEHFFRVKYTDFIGEKVSKMLVENGFDPID